MSFSMRQTNAGRIEPVGQVQAGISLLSFLPGENKGGEKLLDEMFRAPLENETGH